MGTGNFKNDAYNRCNNVVVIDNSTQVEQRKREFVNEINMAIDPCIESKKVFNVTIGYKKNRTDMGMPQGNHNFQFNTNQKNNIELKDKVNDMLEDYFMNASIDEIWVCVYYQKTDSSNTPSLNIRLIGLKQPASNVSLCGVQQEQQQSPFASVPNDGFRRACMVLGISDFLGLNGVDTTKDDFSMALAIREKLTRKELEQQKLIEDKAISDSNLATKEIENSKLRQRLESLEKSLDKANRKIEDLKVKAEKLDKITTKGGAAAAFLGSVAANFGQQMLYKNAGTIGKIMGLSGDDFLNYLNGEEDVEEPNNNDLPNVSESNANTEDNTNTNDLNT